MRQCQFQIITGETTIGKYLRRTLPISYMLQGVCLVCFFWSSARFLLPIFGALLLLLFICVAILEINKAKRYHTSGVIKLSENTIALNNHIISVVDLQQVKAKFTTPRGQGVGRNGIGSAGNQIIIYPKIEDKIVLTVLVEAKAQRDNLAKLLKYWRVTGINVSADGIDLA